MNLSDLKLVLKQIGVETEFLVPRTDIQLQIPCPLAQWLHSSRKDSHPSLSIKFGVPHEHTKFKCWTCKEQGKLSDLVDTYGHLSKNQAVIDLAIQLLDKDKPSLSARFDAIDIDGWVRDPEDMKVPVLAEEVLSRFHPAYEDRRAASYLTRRKVDEKDSTLWGLLYDSRNDRIVFPVRDFNNDLLGAVGRCIDDDVHPKYYNYLTFPAGKTLGGFHEVDPFTPKLIVVEGFFDVIRCFRWAIGFDASVVCTWRAEMSETQSELILGMDKTVSIWYDPI